MSEAAPTPEMLAFWAAEQLWDWRVRMLFAIVCVIAALIALFVYLKWGRTRENASMSKARTYLGRISVTMFVITVVEQLFFKDGLASLLLLGTAIVIGVVGLRMPRGGLE